MSWIMALVSAGLVYRGGLLGVHATVEAVSATRVTLNVNMRGRSLISDGMAVMYDDGSVWMDPITTSRLAMRGVYIRGITLEPGCVRVHARIPILGDRTVTLLQQEE